MTPRVRKLALWAHVTLSVGWLGAVVPYIALAIAALTTRDAQTIHAAYDGMRFIGWFVIVPLSLLAFGSGLVQSLGTRWGLVRHWWVVAKLGLTLFAVVILLQHMRDLARASLAHGMAGMAGMRIGPELMHSGGGLVVLVAIAAISVFKPWGLTPFGRRRLARGEPPAALRRPVSAAGTITLHGRQVPWTRFAAYHALALAALFVLLHVADHGLHRLVMPR